MAISTLALNSISKIKFRVTATRLTLLYSLFIALAYNQTLWIKVYQRLNLFSVEGFEFCLMLAALIAFMVYLVCTPFIHKSLLKPVMILLLIITAIIAWFNRIGVVIDESMIQNIAETDTREVTELINRPSLIYFLVFAVIPCLIIYKVKIEHAGYGRELISRFAALTLFFGFIVLLTLLDFRFISYFGRENRDLRLYLNPIYPLISLERFLESDISQSQEFASIGLDARQVIHGAEKTVGILVVGETARADHFALNGYQKNTTPLLASKNIINFPHMTSCGTSTAYSVPCMFSFYSADRYSPAKAQRQSNLLDVLEHAGIKTLWRDNNSSCKGVCNRIESLNFRNDMDPRSTYFHNGEYVDEVLLDGLEDKINSMDSDVLIVLHQMGSHGPAYHKRYPQAFAKFLPVCDSNSPQSCTNQEVNNSYDNTILYTDYFLAKAIDFLAEHDGDYRSFLIYVSDHGESLGENGIYLHGLPSIIAPEAQTHIPLLLWLSNSMMRDSAIDRPALENCRSKKISHDYLSHSVLSLFHVDTELKQNELDLFDNGCYE